MDAHKFKLKMSSAGKSNMSISSCSCSCSPSSSVKVRKGHVPVIIVAKQGHDDHEQSTEKVWIPIKLMNHPRIVALLKDQADEFGFHQEGVLKIRYDLHLFKGMIESLSNHKYVARTLRTY